MILAVSGGSDSLALLFLVKDHLKTLSIPPEMIAVTVDHQLRKESAGEALIVAEICRAHRIKHVTVRWEGTKPKTHIASSARMARYDLLFQEAEKQGATLIMTGHTLNDQVETYQMRSQRLRKNKDWQDAAFEGMHDGGIARASGVVQSEAFEGVRDRVYTGAFADVVKAGAFEGMHDGGIARASGVVQSESFEGVRDRVYTGAFADVVKAGAFEGMHDGRTAGASGSVQSESFETMQSGVSFTEAREKSTQENCVVSEKNDALLFARGLSCMAREAVLRQKVRLIRPLLGVKRETLRAYLRFKGTTWIDDPSNENCNFERVRVRQSLHPKTFAGIAQKIHEAARARRQQAKMIADLILALDIMVEYGRCFIAKPAPFLEHHSGFPFVVGLFAVLMGGGFYLLPKQKLTPLVQKLCLYSCKKQRVTYAGSVIEYNRNGIAFWREARNMREAVVAPKTTFLWDGRYQISNYGDDAVKVRAAGLEELKSLLKKSHIDLENPHFPSLQSLPMISNNKGYDIPELTNPAIFQQNIIIKRIMAPFHWLFSCEDATLVNVLEPFFNIEVKR
nr:tRNA lysidine(34) synthetase TilS [Bartonella sp. ML70XJBT.G]